jgi:hypothetical protein
MTSTILLNCGEEDKGITVGIPKEIILQEMAAKLSKLSQHILFDLVRELSDTLRILEVYE